MNTVFKILILFWIYKIWKKLKYNIEKLEEYNGEFIYTFFKGFSKKEIYFNLSEIKYVFFTRIVLTENKINKISFSISLNDGYSFTLNKKVNCITLLKSIRKNSTELYEKVLKNVPMGLDISKIIEREIENL